MQMNHNMGWDGIKDPSLINDKPGWNPLFHGSAIGKLQAPWKRSKRTHTGALRDRLTDAHVHKFGMNSLAIFQLEFYKLVARTFRETCLTCHLLPVSLYFRNSIRCRQVDDARLRLWGEGNCCLCSLVLSSAQTDAQACVNDSLSPRMSAGCHAACYSLQVKCLWRHMEQGKLTTRGNSPQQREVLLVSPPNKI